MKQITDVEIAEAIERNCPRELDKIGMENRKRIVFLSVKAAMKEFDFFPPGFRTSFMEKARQAKQLSKRLEKLSKETECFGMNHESFLQESQRLKAHGAHLCKCVTWYGRKDHDEGRAVLVMNVLAVKPLFKNWEALSHVIAEAYLAAGREADAKHITADALLRAAKPYRKGLTPRKQQFTRE